MPEPDSPNDEVFYEPVAWHFPRGLSVKGDVDFLGALLGNGQSLVNKAVPTSGEKFLSTAAFTSTVSLTATPGVLYLTPIILPAIVIASIECEIVTTPASAGGLLRMCMALPESYERPFPKTVVADCGTVSAETTGQKLFDVTPDYNFAGGLLWVGVVSQGTPTTGPTIRTVGNTTIALPVPTATGLGNNLPSKTGITGAVPAELSGFTMTSFSAAVAVRAA